MEDELTEPWLSADDIAAHLGVTKDTVYTWIAEKNMPAHKIGRLWKFQATEIDDWVRRGGAAIGGGGPAVARLGVVDLGAAAQGSPWVRSWAPG